MKIYFAGVEAFPGALFGLSINVLFSYWNSRNKFEELMDICHLQGWPVFLDSGAFSAMTKGVKIDVLEYIEFCQQWGDRVEVICSLDVIGDHRASRKNHEKMLNYEIPAIPVFHVRSPFSELRRLAKKYDYIGLGVAGMQARRKQVGAWLLQCFREIRSVNPDCKVHGFALTSWEFMRDFPFESVDSTTWINFQKYNEVIMHMPYGIQRVRATNKHDLIELMPRALTQTYPLEKLLVPRYAKSKQYWDGLNHNVRSFNDYVHRLNSD